jgi:hypothetical protein
MEITDKEYEKFQKYKEQNQNKNSKQSLQQKVIKTQINHECDLCHNQWTTYEPILNGVMAVIGQAKHSTDTFEAKHATCFKCFDELTRCYGMDELANMLIDTSKKLGRSFIPTRKV